MRRPGRDARRGLFWPIVGRLDGEGLRLRAGLWSRDGRGRRFVELTPDGLTELRRELIEPGSLQALLVGYDPLQVDDPDGNELLFPVSE